MKATIPKTQLWLVILAISLFLMKGCKEDTPPTIIFTPSDAKISALYEKMRFVIVTPKEIYYEFSSDSTTLSKTVDNKFRYYLLPIDVMKEVSYNLSDTTFFKWEEMLSSSPYPVDHVVLLIYGNLISDNKFNDYMCSIGTAKDAVPILNSLFDPTKGDARIVVDELIKSISKK